MKNKFLTFAVIGLLALEALILLFWFVGESSAVDCTILRWYH